MLSELKEEANKTLTENGAAAYRSTLSHCLDFFAVCGALRQASDGVQYRLFSRAYAENSEIAMKILFYARDIRDGLGERELFREIISWLAWKRPSSVRKNIPLMAEYGRWDDLLALFGTNCEEEAICHIRKQMEQDISALRNGGKVSLLGKWLPSVNTSSAERRIQAKRLCRSMRMTEKEYRKTVAALRSRIDIVEKRLCASDYSFDYGNVPSGAMLKYRGAFFRNDRERYSAFLTGFFPGKLLSHTDTVYPYEIIHKCIDRNLWDSEAAELNPEMIRALDASWKSLPDYCDGRNAIAVVDGSGSMYWGGKILPAEVAMSLGIYFAERNTGFFKDHFITFSETPRLVELKGDNIVERTAFCMSYNEAENTNLCAVFNLLLETAVRHHLPQEDLPGTLYILSDMEFDEGVDFDWALFEEIKASYEKNGYTLPALVYWNVNSRSEQYPVRGDDSGAVLVSGASPVVFKMAIRGSGTPLDYMMEVIGSDRYLPVTA